MRRWNALAHFRVRFGRTLILLGLVMAALLAPPSVFANPPPPAETAPVPPPPPAPPAPVVPAAPANAIRIGLGRSQSQAAIGASGGLLVVAGDTILHQSEPGRSVRLTLLASGIQVEGRADRFQSIRLLPVQAKTEPPAALPGTPPFLPAPPPVPTNPLHYNDRSYRGEIEVLVNARDGKLSVVNVIALEEYLLGVVPREMPALWPQEALKAQAVAARTYALRSMGNYISEGFDLVDTPLSQAYGGLSVEHIRTSEAVAATRGQVLTYNGQLAVTFYHASSGGYTENNENIFTGPPLPYLRGVPDFDNTPNNPNFHWRLFFTPEEFAAKFRDTNQGVGGVAAVTPTGVMGASGRPSKWLITGFNRVITLTGQEIRNVLGLRSSPRVVNVIQPGAGNAIRTYTDVETVYVVGADGKSHERTVRSTAVIGADRQPILLGAAATAMGPVTIRPGGVEVIGGGWGHGVGMSQYGAYGMALQGKTYGEILTHYYTGTKVETR